MNSRNKEGTPLRIALIQGNIPQDIKWEPKFQEETVERLHRPDQAGQSIASRTWSFGRKQRPLSSFRILFLFNPASWIWPRRWNVPLLFGSPAYDRKDREIHYFNSAFLISPEKKILGRYDKIHLVPFGEYAPLSGILGFTRDIIGAMGDFHSGEEVRNLALPQGKFGVLICYEAIFPDLTRQFVDRGARVPG